MAAVEARICNWIVNSSKNFFIIHLKRMTIYADIEVDEKKRNSGGDFSARK